MINSRYSKIQHFQGSENLAEEFPVTFFFSLEVANASTAIVHAANNAFKIGVVGKHADKTLVLQFGIPAIIAAFVGVLIGKRYLHKMTMSSVQTITGVFLLGIAIALGRGII